ncbi:MAG: TetR/AcrR family transcriptional regulator [Actinomycetia bacterium]|nr:TetR/AcrR family transcriptional regulator [Actinomycetes bacterium]
MAQTQSSTRDRLVAATVEALRAEGLNGLTSRQIASTAGVNLQAITYHFGSKDSLVALALTEVARTRLDPVRSALEADGDPAERLFDALATINAALATGRDDLETYAEAMSVSSTNPELAQSLSDLHDELAAYLSALIAELQHNQYIQPWVVPDAMAALLIAIGDGLAAHAQFGDPDVEAVLDQVALLLLSARNDNSRIWPTAARLLLRRTNKQRSS